jgi:hypothetical protein
MRSFLELPLDILKYVLTEFLDKRDIYHLKMTCKEMSKTEYRNVKVSFSTGIRYYQFKHLINLWFDEGDDTFLMEKLVLDFTPLISLEAFTYSGDKYQSISSSRSLELILPDKIGGLYIYSRSRDLILNKFPPFIRYFIFDTYNQVSLLPKLPQTLAGFGFIVPKENIELMDWFRTQSFSNCVNIYLETPDASEYEIPEDIKVVSVSTKKENFDIREVGKAFSFEFINMDKGIGFELWPNDTLPDTLMILKGIHVLRPTDLEYLDLDILDCSIGPECSLYEFGKSLSGFLTNLTMKFTYSVSIPDVELFLKECPSLKLLCLNWDKESFYTGGDFSDKFQNTTICFMILSIFVENSNFGRKDINLKGFKELRELRLLPFPYLVPISLSETRCNIIVTRNVHLSFPIDEVIDAEEDIGQIQSATLKIEYL